MLRSSSLVRIGCLALAGLVAVGAVAACAGPQKPAVTASPADATLDNLAAELWQAILAHDPLQASFIGDPRYDADLADISAAGIEAWYGRLGDFEHRLEALEPATLTGQRKITAAVLIANLKSHLARHVCAEETWEIDQLDGYQSALPELGRLQRMDSPTAVSSYVTRLSKIEALFAQHLDNLQRGLVAGRTAPKVVVARVIAQLEQMLAQPDESSPYLDAVARATTLSEAQRASLRTDVLFVVSRSIRPSLSRYRDFLRDVYLPKARAEVGVRANPDGAACYAALVRYHTGADLAPETVHALGKEELGRLQGEMDKIAKAEGAADWRAYRKRLEADPTQHLTGRDELLDHDRAIVARATAALPRAFGRLPPIPVDVRPIEAFREADSPAAYYYESADDGSRPAYYYVNTYKPETRPLYNLEALAFHEANPGHHLQTSIAQNLHSLPDVRRHAGMTAFVEGWALYAELLADELGLYSSPSTRFGMLTYQAWRAARLVVDTGMHALGWTREQAVAFLRDNVALPDNEIDNEVDRYIIWPGQALAYMVGRMELQKRRHEAETTLGPRFDLKAFHDALLENGAVPMNVLAEIMDAWRQGQAARSHG